MLAIIITHNCNVIFITNTTEKPGTTTDKLLDDDKRLELTKEVNQLAEKASEVQEFETENMQDIWKSLTTMYGVAQVTLVYDCVFILVWNECFLYIFYYLLCMGVVFF